jgi:hypothetical protein
MIRASRCGVPHIRRREGRTLLLLPRGDVIAIGVFELEAAAAGK